MKILYSLDKHLPETEFMNKVRDKRGYVVLENDIPVVMTRDRHSRWVCQCIICGEMKVFSTKQLIGKSPLPKCLHINTKDFLNSCIDCQITAKLRKI